MANNKLTAERVSGEMLAELAFYSRETTCNPDPNYWLGFQNQVTPSVVLSIIEELQEYRKASKEPVYWQFKSVNGDWLGVGKSGAEQATREGCEVRQLYAAPPLQAVTVPDEQTWEELCINNPEMTMGDAIIRAASWNACRAAMLCSGREKES